MKHILCFILVCSLLLLYPHGGLNTRGGGAVSPRVTSVGLTNYTILNIANHSREVKKWRQERKSTRLLPGALKISKEGRSSVEQKSTMGSHGDDCGDASALPEGSSEAVKVAHGNFHTVTAVHRPGLPLRRQTQTLSHLWAGEHGRGGCGRKAGRPGDGPRGRTTAPCLRLTGPRRTCKILYTFYYEYHCHNKIYRNIINCHVILLFAEKVVLGPYM